MDTRSTLQVVLIAFAASSVAQNFQPQQGFGAFPSPVLQAEDPRDAFRAQDDFRKFEAAALKPKRPPNFESPLIRTVPQQPINVLTGSSTSQRVQGDFQPQTQTRTQAQVVHQQPRPAAGQQQLRQPVRPQTVDQPQIPRQHFQQTQIPRQQFQPQMPRQQFEQPQASKQQFDQPQIPRQQFDQPQAPRQQFDQPQAPRQQFDQPQAPRQQFEQPTAQQVNQHYFNQPAQQNIDPSQDPIVGRRPVHAVRTQPQKSQQSQLNPESQFDKELFQQQAENAQYSFSSSVTDTINDQANEREETRDGLALKGHYSYSDGYFKRTVHYEADQNGYRIVKEEVDAIGDGPIGDPNGRADVSSSVGGNDLRYSITAADTQTRTAQPIAQNEHQPFARTVENRAG